MDVLKKIVVLYSYPRAFGQGKSASSQKNWRLLRQSLSDGHHKEGRKAEY